MGKKDKQWQTMGKQWVIKKMGENGQLTSKNGQNWAKMAKNDQKMYKFDKKWAKWLKNSTNKP